MSSIKEVSAKTADHTDNESTTFFQPAATTVQRKSQAGDTSTQGKEASGTESKSNGQSLDSYVGSLDSSGQGLSSSSRQFFEPRFGQDFSKVRLHTDDNAAKSAEALNASAYTSGNHIVFNEGKYSPNSDEGQRLMAHELTHVVQQNGTASTIQRDPKDSTGPRGGLSIHSPVVDETLAQVSDVHSMIAGRPLLAEEQAITSKIFGKSVDFSRVRLILSNFAAGTTAGNNIRLPGNFDISKPEDQQLIVHEMTHVWQFQHNGAGYITTSLLQQLSAGATRGNRNFAYDYRIGPNNSFFEFAPEQQAFIVENYFAMQRDQGMLADAKNADRSYKSNHLDSKGFNAVMTGAQRSAEITAEMPLHEKLVQQMSSTPFLSKSDLLVVRQKSVLITGPDDRYTPAGSGPQFLPTPNLFEIRWK